MAMRIEDLADPLVVAAAERLRVRAGEIARTRRLIARGRPDLAETESRILQYAHRTRALTADAATPAPETDRLDNLGLQRLIGPTNDILSIEFFEVALNASKAVGRISKMFGAEYGTGFLTGHGLIVTNHHVLPNADDARQSEFELGVEANRIGPAKRSKVLSFDPDRFFLTDKAHDLTLVAVLDPLDEDPPIESFGWHVLLEEQGKIRKGDVINIIQHPRGQEKKTVVHNSHFLHLEDATDADLYCWYTGDTQKGSSGSPVFNNRWEVVALHHKAVPKTNLRGEILDQNGRTMSRARARTHPEDVAWVANEGIRASRIVHAVRDADIQDAAKRRIRDALIKLWSEPGAQRRGQRAAAG